MFATFACHNDTYNMMEKRADAKVSVKTFARMKSEGEKIAMLTAYDYTMARILDQAGVDAILVGDSAANVMAGWPTTLPISLDQMIYHGAAVVRAVRHALVVIDMPFGSYQPGVSQGVEAAVRIMKETLADAVKIEGGVEFAPTIGAIVAAGIPVVGHLGLTPQSVNLFGGYGLRAKEEAEAEKLLSDAKVLEEAGCFALVLEKIPAVLASRVASRARIPVIGIGAGGEVDGQVLVGQDMLGMSGQFRPKFVRRYLDLGNDIAEAVRRYSADVKSGSFPSSEEQY